MKKDLEATNSRNKNNEQDISHEIEPTDASNSQKKIQRAMMIKEKKTLLLKTKKYFQKKILDKVSQRNILAKIQEQILKIKK